MLYDSNNRIEEVTDAAGKVLRQYDYDDQGFRVKKLAKRSGDMGEHTVEVIYPSMYFRMERELEADGSVTGNTTYSVNNIYLNGVRIAELTASGETRYYLTDQVDSVSMVLSEQGRPLTNFEYMPYGETWLERVAPNLKEKHNPKYNSQELDPETDFFYYNARYYDPEVSKRDEILLKISAALKDNDSEMFLFNADRGINLIDQLKLSPDDNNRYNQFKEKVYNSRYGGGKFAETEMNELAQWLKRNMK